MVASHVFTGFDSAWTDSASRPGAIAHIVRRGDGSLDFIAPQPATFAAAQAAIVAMAGQAPCHIVAIDQPTIVPNDTSMRPVERVAASVISALKGGVQPANRGRENMFGDSAAIWPFLRALPHVQTPMKAVRAMRGHYLMEVFPALALPGLFSDFADRLPKYNPANKATYLPEDWRRVTGNIAGWAARARVPELVTWAEAQRDAPRPGKADQDAVDAVLCAIVAYHWWMEGTSAGILIGCPRTGYIVAPTSPRTAEILASAALRNGVPVNQDWAAEDVWQDGSPIVPQAPRPAEPPRVVQGRAAAPPPSATRARAAPAASAKASARLPADELTRILSGLAARGVCIAYSDLLARFGIAHSQGAVQMLTTALNRLGEQQRAAGHPLLAALVVSKSTGLPGAGFFRLAGFPHALPDAEMRRIHRREVERLRAFHS